MVIANKLRDTLAQYAMAWLASRPSHTCYNADLGRSRSDHVSISMDNKKMGGDWAQLFGCRGVADTPLNTPLPHM